MAKVTSNLQQGGKGKSPYARYQKAPYRYSEQYQNWRAAVLGKTKGNVYQLGILQVQRCIRERPLVDPKTLNREPHREAA